MAHSGVLLVMVWSFREVAEAFGDKHRGDGQEGCGGEGDPEQDLEQHQSHPCRSCQASSRSSAARASRFTARISAMSSAVMGTALAA